MTAELQLKLESIQQAIELLPAGLCKLKMPSTFRVAPLSVTTCPDIKLLD